MYRYLRPFGFLMALSLAFSEKDDLSHTPRMTLTEEVLFKRFPLQGDGEHMELLQGPEENTVYAAGRQLLTIDFRNLKFVKSPVFRKDDSNCTSADCQYNITALHKNEDTNQLLICGTNRVNGLCCHMNRSSHPTECILSEEFKLQYQAWEPSLLIGSSDFYTTKSGNVGSLGIHRLGKNSTRPKDSYTEQKYLSLAVSGPRENRLQDKLYAFYIEKKKNPESVESPARELWLPRVAQICMVDIGGPKMYFQFEWTSQLRAQLICGDPDNRQYFNMLVDVVTLKAERWQDTRVYTLFRNIWGPSAVCVYTMGDIDHVFTNSGFKGYTGSNMSQRPGECVRDSKQLPQDFLKVVDEHSEMEQPVRPADGAGPLLVSRHHYTHIRADRVGQHTVLFLSTEKGRIHKVLQVDQKALVIAEYQPFSQRKHILNMLVDSHTRKLYVASSSELVQVDLGNCAPYGPRCEDCVLARDPYCGWNDDCVSATEKTLQDVDKGNTDVCPPKQYASDNVPVSVPLNSKYFLTCPTSSSHAEYSWHHHGNSTQCLVMERQCLLLIDGMGPEQQGVYQCMSEERGYRKTLAQYTLEGDTLEGDTPEGDTLKGGTPGLVSRQLAWVLLIVILVQTLIF